jgi:hypothetical protein
MLKIRRSDERGHAHHGWLEARHTFSFADYYDPAHLHFGVLRVLNQDRIAAGQGFAPHPHRDMEIVTYVLEGSLEHRDSMGNGSRILPGEVQFMSAGTGVQHSEFNASKEELLHLLQMWVFPDQKNLTPRYDQKDYSDPRQGRLCLVVSPDGAEGSITIGQDAFLHVGLLEAEDADSLALGRNRSAWLHVARGTVRANGVTLGPGDGAAITEEDEVRIQSVETADVVLWNLPAV